LIENKFKTYCLYATGEITLVVIGILIALQINNWNQERLEHNKVIYLLNEMISDLKVDEVEFGRDIELFSSIVKSKEKELIKSDFSTTSTEDLLRLISPDNGTFRVSDTTFQKIKNSDLSFLKNNNELESKIFSYYTTDLKKYKIFIDWDIESSTKDADYWWFGQHNYELKMGTDFHSFKDEKTKRKHLLQAIENVNGRNYLMVNYMRKKRVLNAIKEIHKKSTILINEITSELKKTS